MFAFIKFIKQHNKSYTSIEEFQNKFEIFRINISKADSMDVFSPFMDIAAEEFGRQRLNLDASAIAAAKSKMSPYVLKSTFAAPTSFDWRGKAVTHIKDQGQCGSCWAFSAVANIEGVNALVNGKLDEFSEQQIVDCDTAGEDQGCNGGLMDNAFQYVISAGGLESESDYEYVAEDDSCKFDKSKVAVQLSGFKDISKNEDEIASVLVENGPLSVAVNANPFQFYSGGILKPTKQSCNPSALNHGVTLVGYGEEAGVKYWIIKNSWGIGWGEKGYIRLQRGTGACGVNTNVSTSEVVKK